MKRLLLFLGVAVVGFAAIGDNAPAVPATYVTSHPRLPYPDSAFLNSICTGGSSTSANDTCSMVARYRTAAEGWNSSAPGTRINMRYLLIAYAATKNAGHPNATYLAKIEAFANLSGGWSLTTGNGYFDPAIALALAYDWFNADMGGMSAATPVSMRTSLYTMMSGFETNYSGSSPYNDQAYCCSNFKGMYHLLAALAVYPDDAANSLPHLRWSMDVFLNMWLPAWKQVFSGGYCGASTDSSNDCGGGWHEPWNDYEGKIPAMTTWYAIYNLAWATASGRGVSNWFTVDNPWLKNWAYWLMYETLPDFNLAPIGDESRPYLLPEYSGTAGADVGYLDELAAVYNDPTLRGWSRLMNWGGAAPDGFEPSAWPYYAPDSPAKSTNTRSVLSTVKNFPGWGTIFFRTGWTENDTACILRYGDNWWSHQRQDTGAVSCFNRGWLTNISGTYRSGSASAHFQEYGGQAIAQNVPLVYDPGDVYNDENYVRQVSVTAGGTGYTSAPAVVFTGGCGTEPTATASVSGGAVTSIATNTGGASCATPPVISFTGGGGSNATAVAQLTGAFVDRNDGSTTYVTMPNDGGQRRVGSSWGNFAGTISATQNAPADQAQWVRGLPYYHTGKLVAFATGSGNKYAFAAVDMTAAYNNLFSRNAHATQWDARQANTSNRSFRVQKAIEQLTFIPRGTATYLVTYHQLTNSPGNSAFVKKVLWHSINAPTISGNSYTISRTETVTSKPFVNFWPQAWASYITDCPSGCSGSSTQYTYNGELYGWLTFPTGGSLTVVGGAGAEFQITDSNGAFNYNECMITQCSFGSVTGMGLGPFNISSANDGLTITFETGGAQVFTLTHGASRTCQQILTDLAALAHGAATCEGNGYPSTGNRLGLKSSNTAPGTAGVAVAGTALATLGLTAGTYTGGNFDEGLGGVGDMIHPLNTTAPNQPGAYRIEEWTGSSGTNAGNLSDAFINVQLMTSASDTNTVSTAPVTATESNGTGACAASWAVACYVTTWQDNSNTCSYTLTQPQNGVGAVLTAQGSGCATVIN